MWGTRDRRRNQAGLYRRRAVGGAGRFVSRPTGQSTGFLQQNPTSERLRGAGRGTTFRGTERFPADCRFEGSGRHRNRHTALLSPPAFGGRGRGGQTRLPRKTGGRGRAGRVEGNRNREARRREAEP